MALEFFLFFWKSCFTTSREGTSFIQHHAIRYRYYIKSFVIIRTGRKIPTNHTRVSSFWSSDTLVAPRVIYTGGTRLVVSFFSPSFSRILMRFLSKPTETARRRRCGKNAMLSISRHRFRAYIIYLNRVSCGPCAGRRAFADIKQ